MTYAHGEGATKVIENHPGTRVAGMVHVGAGISWAIVEETREAEIPQQAESVVQTVSLNAK
jgi:hypothetical protein